jgi:hypothetical protein
MESYTTKRHSLKAWLSYGPEEKKRILHSANYFYYYSQKDMSKSAIQAVSFLCPTASNRAGCFLRPFTDDKLQKLFIDLESPEVSGMHT